MRTRWVWVRGRSGAGRAGGLSFFFGDWLTALSLATEQQFELRGVQLLTLFAKVTPGQRVEFLAQEGVLALRHFQGLPGLFQSLLQRLHLLAQRVDFLLQRSGLHLNC